MPTGYTADLYEGKDVDFPTFVAKCARAFGATVLLRDASMDVLPTEENVVEPSDYLDNSLASAQSKLDRWSNASPEDVREWTKEYNAVQMTKLRDALTENFDRRESYLSMLHKVNEWVPPSEDHEGLKSFMVDQLKSSIYADTSTEDEIAKWYKALSPDEHKAAEIESAAKSIAYYTEEIEKRSKRNEQRIRWVRELRESLEEIPSHA